MNNKTEIRNTISECLTILDKLDSAINNPKNLSSDEISSIKETRYIVSEMMSKLQNNLEEE